MDEKKQKFELPQQILNQLDECSNGGFMLFRYNQDDVIEHEIYADNQHKALALMSYIRLFIEAQDEVSKDMIKANYFYEPEMDDLGDDEDDSEDFSL